MDMRTQLIAAASQQLEQSPLGDISTRAVCDAVGVGQPVLYRLFGDKDGLLAAVIDAVWAEYLETKRAATATDDPVADLRDGWNAHIAFALHHPNAYRLLFSTALATKADALNQATELLVAVLNRVAAKGLVQMEPEHAAQIVMAANTGLALQLLRQPHAKHVHSTVKRVREATIRAITTEGSHKPHGTRVATATLRAQLPQHTGFTQAEAALLDEWLQRF